MEREIESGLGSKTENQGPCIEFQWADWYSG
jgi:hypothetical protein